MQRETLSNGNVRISDRGIAIFVLWVNTILAALLLVGAITSLYAVESPEKKLVMIGIYTLIFAGVVGVLTNARRAELFAATAAYVLSPSSIIGWLVILNVVLLAMLRFW